MKRIAIITASTPSDTNTGMVTVELAALDLLETFSEYSFTWFSFPPIPGCSDGPFQELAKGKIKYRYLPDALPEIYDYDVIIYWGDFINSRTWLLNGGLSQALNHLSDHEDGLDVLCRCMLLKEAPDEVLKKVIIFGTTVIPDTQNDLSDENYNAAFARLVKNAFRVWMRDPISASRVAQIRAKDENCFGVDPAAIFNHAALAVRRSQASPTNTIGLFVGSRTEVSEDFRRFIDEVSEECSATILWIPWFKVVAQDNRRFVERIKGIVKLCMLRSKRRRSELAIRKTWKSKYIIGNFMRRHAGGDDREVVDLLRMVANCDFIVTDTYHLCVNAWRMQVPAVCIGLSQPNVDFSNSSLDDMKKIMLYSSYYANDLYLTPQRLSYEGVVCKVASYVKGEHANAIAKRYTTHANNIRIELNRAIALLLDN